MKTTETRMEALVRAITWWGRERDIFLYTDNGWGKRNAAKTWGVNWSAMGTQPPEKALEYADTIRKAAALATALNAMELVVDSTVEDADITDYEGFQKFSRRLFELIDSEEYETLAAEIACKR